jgi:hypothetical protein
MVNPLPINVLSVRAGSNKTGDLLGAMRHTMSLVRRTQRLLVVLDRVSSAGSVPFGSRAVARLPLSRLCDAVRDCFVVVTGRLLRLPPETRLLAGVDLPAREEDGYGEEK